MNAKLLAVTGAFVHFSGGEMSLPWQVYFPGIGWPSAKAVLVIWMLITFGGWGWSAPPAGKWAAKQRGCQ